MGGRKRARRRKRRQREFLINSSRQNQEEVERREKSKAEAARAAAEALQARLFVRKLNYSATANDIRKYFEARVGEPGSVLSVYVLQGENPRSLVAGVKSSRGMAEVQMANSQLALRVLDMCTPDTRSASQATNQRGGRTPQLAPRHPGGLLQPPVPATPTSAIVHIRQTSRGLRFHSMALHTDLHSYQPLAVAPARPGHKDRSGSAHAKGDFVSVPIQQLHIGCLVTGQQRQQLGQDPPDRKQRRQPAGSAVQGSLLVSERLIKPDLFQELYLQLNMRKRIFRIRCNYDLFPSLRRPLLQRAQPCVTKIEAKFKVVHEALQPVVASGEGGSSLPQRQKALAVTFLQPPRISRGTPKPDAFGSALSVLENGFQYSADYDDDDDFNWSRLPDVTEHGSFGRCMTYCVMLGPVAVGKLQEDQVTRGLVSFSLLPQAAQWQGLWSRAAALPELLIMEVTEPQVAAQVSALQQQLAGLPAPVAWHLGCLLGSGAIHMWHLEWSRQLDDQTSVLSLLASAPEFLAVKVLETLIAGGERPLLRNLSLLLQQLLAEYGVRPGGGGAGSEADSEEEEEEEEQWDKRAREEDKRQSGVMMVPRVLVTPTRVRLLPPQAEEGNRLLRAFTTGVPGLDEWTVVRVQVGDEDGQRLFSGLQGSMDHVWDHLRASLAGLNLGGRPYQFLVYSSSQLKEQSILMIRNTPETLRPVLARVSEALGGAWHKLTFIRTPMHAVHTWMGSFSHIKVPAKAAARMGQALSTTQRTIHVAQGEDRTIDDVERGGYCFTDGAGQISLQLLKDALKEMDERRRRRRAVPWTPDNVSALQIRWGGAKGVVSLNPLLPGRRLVLRKSMVKFPAPHHRELEVCTVARLVVYYLNRQLILLLSNAGVPDHVFLAKQRDFIRNLDTMLEDPVTAAEVLPTLGGINCLYVLQDMLDAGISPQDDPFLSSCLRAVRRHSLMMLRQKARILVPPSHAATLVGSPDDSGLLGEDEVFLQVGEPARGEEFRVISGPVLVTKHPVTHPGDVRILTAVDTPAARSYLGHHKNELVFSVRGDRPLPNQMSGSDLDGDQYAVTWDESLFPPTPNYPPQGYEGAKAEEKENIIIPEDLIDHFINHAKNDNLGRICKAWEAHADQALMKGTDIINVAVCTKLSELASIAVDFPKSGVPAQLEREHLPQTWPHWHDDKRKEMYDSTTIVGQLFDAVVHETERAAKEDKADMRSHWQKMGLLQNTQRRQGSRSNSDSSDEGDDEDGYDHLVWPDHCDPLLRVEGLGQQHDGWRGWVDLARRLQDRYVHGIHQLLNRYGLKDEGELITGCVRKFHKLAAKAKQHETREAVKLDVEALARVLRRHLFEEVLARRSPQHLNQEQEQQQQDPADMGSRSMYSLIEAVGLGSPDLVAAASACYWVAYSHDGAGRDHSLTPLLGLPWVVAGDVLAQYRAMRVRV